MIYISFFRPILEYASIIWDNCTQYEQNEIEKVQVEPGSIVSGTNRQVSIPLLYENLDGKNSGQESLNKT